MTGEQTDQFARAEHEICRQTGHEWVDAGGGMDYCVVCQREKWADERTPIPLMARAASPASTGKGEVDA